MKHLISSVTIGACLLLSSAGGVFAQAQTGNPHTKAPPSVGGGQLGTVGTGAGLTNGGTAACPGSGATGSPPGQVDGSSNSPFVTAKVYAGSNSAMGLGPGNPSNAHSNSQYDNACLRQAL
jgi:hypothetical protein